jgi:lipoprotein signal peptidase
MRTSLDIAIAQSTQPAPVSARRSLSAHAIFWITVVLALVVDLWSKAWVFENLGAREIRTVIPGVLEFRRSLNDGAVFGTFSGRVGVFIVASLFALAFVLYLFLHSSARQRILHISLALILAGALGNLYDRAFMMADVVQHHDGRLRFIGKVMDDGAGPTVRVGDWPDGGSPESYARADVDIHRQGVVRDFLKFVPVFPRSFPSLGGNDVWPWIFNVADAALVVGVIVLMLTSMFERSPRRSH